MKATEIRAGNLIYNQGGGASRRVMAVTGNVISELSKGRAGRISPIVLNEEWLIKFGFEQNSGIASREYHINKFNPKDKVVMVNHYENGYLFAMEWWRVGIMIKHVHQLQNLYHTVTGKEL